jgi:putative copper export protein
VTWNAVLVFVHMLATSVWVGGFVAIAVVARVAKRELGAPARVVFFRSLGRTYGMVGGSALAVALLTGTVLMAERGWDQAAGAAVLLALALVLSTVAGIAQARAMTRLRQRAVDEPFDASLHALVERRARRALMMRTAIGALTLALVALGATLTV